MQNVHAFSLSFHSDFCLPYFLLEFPSNWKMALSHICESTNLINWFFNLKIILIFIALMISLQVLVSSFNNCASLIIEKLISTNSIWRFWWNRHAEHIFVKFFFTFISALFFSLSFSVSFSSFSFSLRK